MGLSPDRKRIVLGPAPERNVVSAALLDTAQVSRRGIRGEVLPSTENGERKQLSIVRTGLFDRRPHVDQQHEAMKAEVQQHSQTPPKDAGHHAVRTLITIAVEMIPGGIGPYGIGDIVTLIEGLLGRTIDGLTLNAKERGLYFLASLIPVVPARPIIFFYRKLAKAGRAQAEKDRERAAKKAARHRK